MVDELASTKRQQRRDALYALHERCGVDTSNRAALDLLNGVGWDVDSDLTKSRLLEPCVGNGVIVAHAASILIKSLRKRRLRISFGTLKQRIVGYEILPAAARKARESVIQALNKQGLTNRLSKQLARAWIKTSDFLLTDIPIGEISHVVSNPPYVRWTHVPKVLASIYRARLPADICKGDLCITFIARIVDVAQIGAQIGLLTADRWFYTAYADAFRTQWFSRVSINEIRAVEHYPAFQKRVAVDPYMCFVTKSSQSNASVRPTLQQAIRCSKSRTSEELAVAKLVDRWMSEYTPLQLAGCKIRVGPALGHAEAFVGNRNDLDVESELIARYITPQEISPFGIRWIGRWVICVNDLNGRLIDLRQYPRCKARLDRFRDILSARSCVSNPGEWYRTIDITSCRPWSKQKIVVPDLAREPKAILDRAGFVPSHGIYTVSSNCWPPEVLAKVLSTGILKSVLGNIAPRNSNGWIRCYKRFLAQVPIPKWCKIDTNDQLRMMRLASSNPIDCPEWIETVARTYEVDLDFFTNYVL